MFLGDREPWDSVSLEGGAYNESTLPESDKLYIWFDLVMTYFLVRSMLKIKHVWDALLFCLSPPLFQPW